MTSPFSWPPAELRDGPDGDAWALLELVPRMNRWAEVQAIRARPEGEISLRQMTVLYALGSGQVSRTESTAADLARWMRVRPTVMTRMVDRLERSGYVTRNDDPSDRRRSHIRLTARGQRVMIAVSEALIAQLTSVMECLGPENRRTFADGVGLIEDVFKHFEAGGLLNPAENDPLIDE